MSGFWTALAPGVRRIAALAAILALGLPCAACGKDKTRNVILPLTAEVTFSGTTPPDPGIYFVKNPATGGDLIVLDVMLHSSASVTFDAFNLEIQFDPKIVQLGGDPLVPPFESTPFGNCNTVQTSPSGSGCPPPTPIANPSCLSNAHDADISGDLVLGVSVLTSYCFPDHTTTAGVDTRLLVIAFQGAAVGTSAIKMIPSPTTSGSCDILEATFPVSPAVTCFDGGASITVSR